MRGGENLRASLCPQGRREGGAGWPPKKKSSKIGAGTSRTPCIGSFGAAADRCPRPRTSCIGSLGAGARCVAGSGVRCIDTNNPPYVIENQFKLRGPAGQQRREYLQAPAPEEPMQGGMCAGTCGASLLPSKTDIAGREEFSKVQE